VGSGGAVLRGSGLEECLLVLCMMGDELTTALEKLAQLLVAKNAESTSAEGVLLVFHKQRWCRRWSSCQMR
jgi:hypothetical protein